MAEFKGLKAKGIAQTQNGIASSIVKTEVLKAALAKYGKTNIDDVPDEVSPLGTLVYDSVTLGSTTDKSKNNYLNNLGKKESYEPLKFIEVLLDVSMIKNVVSTPIQGKDGIIKQYISEGDYSILISGKISGQYSQSTNNWKSVRDVSTNYFPETELKTLIAICKVGYHIPVKSTYLNEICGIKYIVINDYKLPQAEGSRNNQSFEIICVSDKDNILEFTEEQVMDSEQLKYILNS